jgi:sterol desaturase/sphingolipid hydroxylase (fatty acid hydroxylase superfamily)
MLRPKRPSSCVKILCLHGNCSPSVIIIIWTQNSVAQAYFELNWTIIIVSIVIIIIIIIIITELYYYLYHYSIIPMLKYYQNQSDCYRISTLYIHSSKLG